jgi:hypothetical protein
MTMPPPAFISKPFFKISVISNSSNLINCGVYPRIAGRLLDSRRSAAEYDLPPKEVVDWVESSVIPTFKLPVPK